MSTDQISIARRIIQANERLRYLSMQWYCGQISGEHYRSERQEIISFIHLVGSNLDTRTINNIAVKRIVAGSKVY